MVPRGNRWVTVAVVVVVVVVEVDDAEEEKVDAAAKNGIADDVDAVVVVAVVAVVEGFSLPALLSFELNREDTRIDDVVVVNGLDGTVMNEVVVMDEGGMLKDVVTVMPPGARIKMKSLIVEAQQRDDDDDDDFVTFILPLSVSTIVGLELVRRRTATTHKISSLFIAVLVILAGRSVWLKLVARFGGKTVTTFWREGAVAWRSIWRNSGGKKDRSSATASHNYSRYLDRHRHRPPMPTTLHTYHPPTTDDKA